MWEFIAKFILRNRIALLISIGLITIFMGYKAQFVSMSYEFGGILPEDDSTAIEYSRFRERFAQDGNVIVLGVQGDIYTRDNFAAWYNLGNDLKKIHGVDSVFSEAHLYTLTKNPDEKKFDVKKVVNRTPQTQAEVDSLKREIRSLPFYRNMLYNDSTEASLMMVFVTADVFNSEQRVAALDEILGEIHQFSEDHMEVHISGLPYIRTKQTAKIKQELGMFVGLAAFITALIMFLFFRSFRVVLVSLLVVGVGVVWSMGIIALFDYKLSILMGFIPPLLIVIGIPNCVFLITKYHNEIKRHGNKIKALQRVIVKIGNATFLTNTTTATGFATFIFTQSDMLTEFGIVASINIFCVFLLSLCIIPSVMSFLDRPKKRHIKHLDRTSIYKVVSALVQIVSTRRPLVYVAAGIFILTSAYGVTLIRSTGNIVDDLPEEGDITQDLRFFENNFAGVMPLEILINTKDGSNILSDKSLRKIESFQEVLHNYDEISRSLSVVDASKFAKQAFYNGNPQRYSLIEGYEKSFIAPYLRGNKNSDSDEIMSLFLDSAKTTTRITAQIADIGTSELDSLMADLKPKLYDIFPREDYKVTLTGTSIVFLKGTGYLTHNLFTSLAIAVLVISAIMATLFGSARMVLISLVPNLLPLLVTAGIMGFFGVPLKPSTLLVFSISFGISVDDTIHFLTKYRQEFKLRPWDLRGCVLTSVRETGVSMIYTSIILLFGFGIFSLSSFGGTAALGILVSVTLFIAMFSNLIFLPSLLLSLERRIITKSFTEPLIEIVDEEEDIELNELEVRKMDED